MDKWVSGDHVLTAGDGEEDAQRPACHHRATFASTVGKALYEKGLITLEAEAEAGLQSGFVHLTNRRG